MTTAVRDSRPVFDGDDLRRELTEAALDFRYFLRNHVYIADRTPDGQLRGVLKWEWWPVHDAICNDLLGYYNDAGQWVPPQQRLAILKARQIGLSWLLAAYQLHGSMFSPSYLGGEVSAGQTESAELLNKSAFIRAHLPYATLPTLVTENKSELRFTATDGAIMAFPSTPNAGRGYTFSRFVADEAAFHEHAAVNYEAYSIAAEYGQIIICSSAGDDEDRGTANPWFQRFWLSARDGTNGFTARFYAYDARPGRDDAWYERESQRLSGRPGAMQREFPRTPEEAFRSMLLLFLDADAIDDGIAYAKATAPLSAVYRMPEVLMTPHLRVWVTPRPGEPYVLGIDGAEGKGIDYTVTHVYEARTLRHVATLRENVLEPAEHGAMAAALAKWYNNAWCMVERSHGEAILIQLTLAGCKVYKHTEPPTRAQRESGKLSEGTPGFPMTGQTRPGLLDDFSEVVHSRALSSPDPVVWDEAQTFVVVVNAAGTRRAEAAGGHHDDCMMASALAVRMARQPGAQTVRDTDLRGRSNVRGLGPAGRR